MAISEQLLSNVAKINDDAFEREYLKQVVAEAIYKLTIKHPINCNEDELRQTPLFLLGALNMAAHFLEASPAYITHPSLRMAIISLGFNVQDCCKKAK